MDHVAITKEFFSYALRQAYRNQGDSKAYYINRASAYEALLRVFGVPDAELTALVSICKKSIGA